MMTLKKAFSVLVFLIVAAPAMAQAKVTCEGLDKILDVPDDQCEAIAQGARRCFTSLNYEFYSAKENKDKVTRAKAVEELRADYAREIQTWQRNLVFMSRIGEGRACINETGEVQQWIEEMELDAKALTKF